MPLANNKSMSTIYGKSWHSRLLVVLISNRVPGIEEDCTILHLSLSSFVITFLEQPVATNVDLAVYMQCSNATSGTVKPLTPAVVENEFIGYVALVQQTVSTFVESFREKAFFCSSTLADAFCHARNTIQDDDILFLLEHDWMLLPSKIPVGLDHLVNLTRGGKSYIMLNRGDRPGKVVTNDPVTLRSGMYSNNPFFAHASFVHSLLSKKYGLCVHRAVFRNWERTAKNVCAKNKLPTYTLGSSVKDLAIYHLDGRYFSFSRRNADGPLFGTLQKEMLLYYNKISATKFLLERMDALCSNNKSACGPYVLRYDSAKTVKNRHGNFLERTHYNKFL